MMKKKFFIALQYILPQHKLSRLAHHAMESRCSWWKNFLIQRFIKTYHVDMSEALNPDALSYVSFNAFFIRELKPQARTIAAGNNQICSPADGTVSQIGAIQQGRIIQAKGFDFTVNELIGGDSALTEKFKQGIFTTIYLAPKDYHRVHMPLAGSLRQMIFVPGQLFSVNDTTAQTVPRLFARNERVVFVFETERGPMIVIMVGAFFVASIATPWAGVIAPNSAKTVQTTHYEPNQVTLAKGAELGYFKLGSTAIVLFPQQTAHWFSTIQAGDTVSMGQAIGELTHVE